MVIRYGIDQTGIDRLKNLYFRKWEILNHAQINYHAGTIENIKEFSKDLEQLEYDLQTAWGLPQNRLHHIFWNHIASCTCRKDQPKGQRIENPDCPLHGEKIVSTLKL